MRSRWLFLLVLLATGWCPAAELSSTNLNRLANIWSAAERKAEPVTIVSFGDSMADSYQSITFVLMNKFRSRLGVAGYSLNNYANALMWNLEGGASLAAPSEFWFTDHFEVPDNGSVWWANQQDSWGLESDRLGLFWVAHSGGGSIAFQVSTNGGPWTTVKVLAGHSATPQGCFTNISVPLNYHRLRVRSNSGRNIVLGPQVLNTQSTGAHFVFMDKAGIPLSTVTNVPLSIRAPVMMALAPQLLIWHMKEDGSAATAARLEECEQWWHDAAPECDVLYLGTPWVSADLSSTLTIDQNTVVRSAAVAHGRAYVDCLTPATSYTWMQSMNYMGDGTHLNLQGSTFLANIAWNELGFFALGAARQIDLIRHSSHVTLEYRTSSGVRYTLQSDSGNGWQSLHSHLGTGAKLSTNVSATGTVRLFRLGLTSE